MAVVFKHEAALLILFYALSHKITCSYLNYFTKGSSSRRESVFEDFLQSVLFHLPSLVYLVT